jgi:hypothetical protein
MIYNPVPIHDYGIYDIFHNTSNNIVIVSPWNPKSLKISYNNKKFQHISCPHKHTHLYILSDRVNYNSVIELTINGKNMVVHVNKYPEFKNEIIMSTMVQNEDNYIRQWIRFHLNLGINRFVIYDNSGIDDKMSHTSLNKSSNLEAVISDFIETGLVVLIKWRYPKRTKISGISGQSTRENHCVWAFKSSKYIGMFDIDEYVNIQTDHTNIDVFLDKVIVSKHINIDNIGGFRLRNKFFYNPHSLPCDDFKFLNIYNCDEITPSGRENNIIN